MPDDFRDDLASDEKHKRLERARLLVRETQTAAMNAPASEAGEALELIDTLLEALGHQLDHLEREIL